MPHSRNAPPPHPAACLIRAPQVNRHFLALFGGEAFAQQAAKRMGLIDEVLPDHTEWRRLVASTVPFACHGCGHIRAPLRRSFASGVRRRVCAACAFACPDFRASCVVPPAAALEATVQAFGALKLRAPPGPAAAK